MKDECNQVTCGSKPSETPITNDSSALTPKVKPDYRVSRDDASYTVRVFLPGVAKDGVNLSVDHHLLTIEAERNDAPDPSWNPVFRELDRSGYLLQLKLSPELDGENIKATVENGVLTLVLPVAEAAKPRAIPVA